jgi:hypothetical protein
MVATSTVIIVIVNTISLTAARVGRRRELTLRYVFIHILREIARLLTRLGVHVVYLD